MQNYVQPGKTLTLAAPYDRLSGQGALVGHIFGVATVDVLSGVSAEFLLEGVLSITSDTGTAYAVGDLIYWDDSGKTVTKTSSGNKLIGAVVAVKASGATSAKVRLNGIATT